MVDGTGGLSDSERAVVAEEEALLASVRASLARAEAAARAKRHGSELRSVEAFRELRDEAASASADDLPALMLELSVRQRLLARGEERRPEPASPYLAHLRVREGGSAKDYLLGRVSFLDPAAGVRVVDWRVAPVSQLFYRYREGDEYEEELPGRLAEGRVEARRIVIFARGQLVQIVGDGFVLSRGGGGEWTSSDRSALALHAGGAGTAARPGALGVGAGVGDRGSASDVTALLDAEQFAAITAPPDRPLLVLGSAGSGKTTVALHRLARIAATEPGAYDRERMKVVVPEEGLARLSRRLLEPLDMGATQVDTLDGWAYRLARHVFGGKLPRLCADAPGLVSSLKRHPALYAALRARFAARKPARTTLPRLRRRLGDLFSDRGFLDGVVASSSGTLPRSAVEETVRHTMLQLADRGEAQLRRVVDPAMKHALDGRMPWEGTPDELAGTIDVEDLPILLLLEGLAAGLDAPSISHLVLDEAEDFAPFELWVLGSLLGQPRSVTLAGDEAQQTSSSFAGWSSSLSTLGVGDADVCRLGVSYRCPRPIAALAREVLGPLSPDAPTAAARDGAPVGLFCFPDEAQAHLFLANAIRDLALREPNASIGVIAHEPETARAFSELLADLPEARLVVRGDFGFEPGVDVTFVDDVKGLEFDYVAVPDATLATYPATDEARRRLHVAVTRASHQLWIVAGGAPTPLVPALSASR